MVTTKRLEDWRNETPHGWFLKYLHFPTVLINYNCQLVPFLFIDQLGDIRTDELNNFINEYCKDFRKRGESAIIICIESIFRYLKNPKDFSTHTCGMDFSFILFPKLARLLENSLLDIDKYSEYLSMFLSFKNLLSTESLLNIIRSVSSEDGLAIAKGLFAKALNLDLNKDTWEAWQNEARREIAKRDYNIS